MVSYTYCNVHIHIFCSHARVFKMHLILQIIYVFQKRIYVWMSEKKYVCKKECMSMREYSGNRSNTIEAEAGCLFHKLAHIQVSNSREGEEENSALLQGIRVLRNSLSSPQTVTSWSLSLKRDRTGSSASSITQNMVESELRELGNTRMASTGQAAAQSLTGQHRSLQHQTQKHFCNWTYQSRKRNQTAT